LYCPCQEGDDRIFGILWIHARCRSAIDGFQQDDIRAGREARVREAEVWSSLQGGEGGKGGGGRGEGTGGREARGRQTRHGNVTHSQGGRKNLLGTIRESLLGRILEYVGSRASPEKREREREFIRNL